MALFRFLIVLSLLTAAACAPRDPIAFSQGAQGGTVYPIFVGTTRTVDPELGFGSGRSRDLNFARYDISVPPEHQTGEIERSRATPDPDRHFVAVGEQSFSQATDFTGDLSHTLQTRPHNARNVTIFVHGFNNTLADGVYRTAQIGHDFGINDVMVHYSWPSAAHFLGYVHDRDSVLFARDGLESLIRKVKAAGASRVLLIGHSLGTLLVMDTLRQIAIADQRALDHLIDEVVLISADIDVDVFHQMASRISRLPKPFLILTSTRDRALKLSARLTGRQTERLGNISGMQRISDLEVTLIDTTEFSKGIGHFSEADSPALIQILSQLRALSNSFENDPAARIGLVPGALIVVQKATEIVLAPIVN
ncbi:MAG: alpha/beta fold hydrolase [Marinosulfonomonas sp.]|nr:alpha/beta fold hydrolase [Marinosulfonomonas sp.]